MIVQINMAKCEQDTITWEEEKKKEQQHKVGPEEEGSSSNWPELAEFLRALRDTLIEEQMLYLRNN